MEVHRLLYGTGSFVWHPEGLEACFSAVKWVYAHAEELGISQKKIGVGGDSAGGNLALLCALWDRDEGTRMISYAAQVEDMLSEIAADMKKL